MFAFLLHYTVFSLLERLLSQSCIAIDARTCPHLHFLEPRTFVAIHQTIGLPLNFSEITRNNREFEYFLAFSNQI